MDRDTSKRLFQDADERFQQGDYHAALSLLEELARAYPDDRHVLFPMAKTLARLGRYREAIDINQRVIDRFDYSPAKELQQQLHRKAAEILTVDLDPGKPPGFQPDNVPTPSLGDIPGFPQGANATSSPSGLPTLNVSFTPTRRTAPPPLPRAIGGGGFNWIPWLIVAAVVAVYVALTVVTVQAAAYWEYDEVQDAFVYGEGASPSSQYAAYALFWVVGYMAGVPAGFCALLVTNLRKHYDFYEDVKDVALYVLICTLLYLIPFVGWIAVFVVLYNHYETGFLKLIVMAIVYNVVGLALAALLLIPVITAYGPTFLESVQ